MRRVSVLIVLFLLAVFAAAAFIGQSRFLTGGSINPSYDTCFYNSTCTVQSGQTKTFVFYQAENGPLATIKCASASDKLWLIDTWYGFGSAGSETASYQCYNNTTGASNNCRNMCASQQQCNGQNSCMVIFGDASCGDPWIGCAKYGRMTVTCRASDPGGRCGAAPPPPAPAVCGNGIKEGLEDCDNGANNSNSTPNACRTLCKNPSCGDTVTDTGEECDDGPTGSSTCTAACKKQDAKADIAVTTSVEPSTLTRGQAAQAAVVVSNMGPGDAYGVITTITVTAPLKFSNNGVPFFGCNQTNDQTLVCGSSTNVLVKPNASQTNVNTKSFGILFPAECTDQCISSATLSAKVTHTTLDPTPDPSPNNASTSVTLTCAACCGDGKRNGTEVCDESDPNYFNNLDPQGPRCLQCACPAGSQANSGGFCTSCPKDSVNCLCPAAKPKRNVSTNTCEACPANTTYESGSNTCKSSCPTGSTPDGTGKCTCDLTKLKIDPSGKCDFQCLPGTSGNYTVACRSQCANAGGGVNIENCVAQCVCKCRANTQHPTAICYAGCMKIPYNGVVPPLVYGSCNKGADCCRSKCIQDQCPVQDGDDGGGNNPPSSQAPTPPPDGGTDAGPPDPDNPSSEDNNPTPPPPAPAPPSPSPSSEPGNNEKTTGGTNAGPPPLPPGSTPSSASSRSASASSRFSSALSSSARSGSAGSSSHNSGSSTQTLQSSRSSSFGSNGSGGSGGSSTSNSSKTSSGSSLSSRTSTGSSLSSRSSTGSSLSSTSAGYCCIAGSCTQFAGCTLTQNSCAASCLKTSSSSTSSILIFASCRGTECADGGNAFCGQTNTTCVQDALLPCIRCIAPPPTLDLPNPPTIFTPITAVPLPPALLQTPTCNNDGTCGAASERCVQNHCLTATQVASLPPFCGNGRLDIGEQCDNGMKNADTSNATCRTNCSVSKCGDGIVDLPAESCDAGSRNGAYDSGCDVRCQILRPAGEVLPGMVIELPFSPTQTIETNTPITSSVLTAPEPPANVASGPGTIAIMAAGAAGGYAWIRRRKQS